MRGIPMPTPSAPHDVNAASPTRLDGFVGQPAVVEAIRVALGACRHSGATFPSSIFGGPPGVGKSNLAAIVAAELGVVLHETLGQTLLSPGDLQSLLIGARNGEVVFIDEADELPAQQQTLLYRALAERKLFLPRGRGSRHSTAIPLDDFSLVMATNHESALARPLVERFKMIFRFEFYTAAQIEQLLAGRVAALRWDIRHGVLGRIASRSRGVPREGLRILEGVRRVAASEGADVVTEAHFERACEIDGIDGRGLGRTERKYLRILAAENAPVRPGVLCDRLGVPLRTLQTVIEPFLVREGLVSRTDGGRVLTGDGLGYVRDSASTHP